MNYRLLARIFGLLLMLLAACMGVCTVIAFAYQWFGSSNSGFEALLYSSLITAAVGGVLFTIGMGQETEILRREAVVVVGLGWIISAIFGALPFYLADHGLSSFQALFESTSGFTTTGSTVIRDLETWPKPILLWRAGTQWLGGLGILVLFVALLSSLGVGSKSLFNHESSLRKADNTGTMVHQTARMLWKIYLVLTVITIVGLMLLGMDLYEAVTHAFAAVATGGFSPYSESIGYFRSTSIEIFLVVVMMVVGTNFLLYPAIIKGQWRRLLREEEARAFYLIVLVSAVVLTSWLCLHSAYRGFPWHTAACDALFNVVSLITTTGFVTNWRLEDHYPLGYSEWPPLVVCILFVLMVIGGSAGSTAGGVKVGRLIMFFKVAHQEIVSSFRPRMLFKLKMNGVDVGTTAKSAPFHIALFLVVLVAGAIALMILEPGKGLMTCFSASAATLFNIGPGLADVGVIGPGNNVGPTGGNLD
jgi:trk system potassium uptake protein TrkH